LEEIQTLLASYGLWIVAAAVVLDQIGVPIPAPPTLVLAGTLVGSGELDAATTLAAATLAALPADLAWFEIGRRRGRGVLRLLCRISLEPDYCVRNTSESFARRGPMTLLFAKFFPGLQTIAPPLAGASGMSRLHFLTFDVPGAAVWAGSFLVIGALLHDQIDRLLNAFSDVVGQLALFLLASLATWIGWKFWHRQRFLRTLRTARIEPDELWSLYERNSQPSVFDLRHPDEIQREGRRLPGARLFRAGEPPDLDDPIPLDREIILYCT
jgi:membrane protein DedA with SNARE-associated domain